MAESSRVPQIPEIIPGNWDTVRRFSRDVGKYMRSLAKSNQTIYLADLYLTSSTASRLLATDASQKIVSTELSSWVTGTANEINITDDGDGTITIGIADPLIVAKGGTGTATLTDHSILLGSGTDAITSLGAATDGQLAIGSTGADPVLATITGTADEIAVTNGAGSITLSLDGDIGDIAGLTPDDGNFIVGDGANWVTESGNTARTSLGLGTGDSPTFTNGTYTGGLRIGSSNPITAGGVNLARGGTSEPYYKFENDGGNNELAQIRGLNGGGLRFTTGDAVTEWARFDASGNFGIGATSLSHKFTVTGTVDFSSTLDVGGATSIDGLTSILAQNGAGSTEQIRIGRNDNGIRYHSIFGGHASGTSSFLRFDIHDGGLTPFTGQNTVLTLYGETPEAEVAGLITSTSTTPYLFLHNTTEEDTDGGRESRINFKGEQSGGEESTLARIEVSHDGSSDDEKGKIVFSTNDGSDSDTPTDHLTIDAAGNTYIGDRGSNYAEFKSDGELNLHGTARVYKDIQIGCSQMKKGVGSPPGEGLIDGFPTLDYDDSSEEESFCAMFGPLDWAGSTDATIHLEFFVDTAPAAAANVVWGVEYKSIPAGGTIDFSSGTTTDTDTVAITTGTPANDKKLHESTGLTFSNLVQDGVLLFRLFRDATNASDTYTGDARFLKAHVHYTSDKLGTAL